MKSQRKNKFILHLFFLLLLGNSLIAFPNMQVQAATAKTYKVKINRVHKGELVKKKSGWYLQSKTYKITTRAAEKPGSEANNIVQKRFKQRILLF